ncbi:MAG: hypothetical protein KF798_05650 [Candidatus Paracaedibacteraceae bacterium]|nr:hypothetical protein [Candidatus Paracaedibacteraceae bacterium]
MNISIMTLPIIISMATHSFSADNDGAKDDPCMKACNDYYQAQGIIQGFTYYANAFSNRVDQSVTKRDFCQEAQSSMELCYQNSSALYSTCKSYLYSWTGSDWFSSCKTKCSADLTAFCSTPDEHLDQPVDALPKQPIAKQLVADAPQEDPFPWISQLNREDQYTVIFKPGPKGIIRKKVMTGQEIQELSDKNSISKAIAMDRITLSNNKTHVWVNPNDTYMVTTSTGVTDQQTGEQIAQSTQKYQSIIKKP